MSESPIRRAVSGALLVLLAGTCGCGHPPAMGASIDAAIGGGDTAPPTADARDGASGGDVIVVGGDAGVLDPGWSALRPLTNLEYDLTARDLLGVPGTARASFQPEYEGPPLRFAILGDAHFNDARYEQDVNSAEALADAAFADPALRARIVTCAPATPGDPACTRQIISAFGLRAWRRPLTSDEVDGLVALAAAASAGGATFEASIEEALIALLSSAPFLVHVELDSDPASTTPHALAPYELASRLSYLLWSSMPDARLFAEAADGTLAQEAVLRGEVARLLADARAEGFVEGFAGAWLGGDDFAAHEVEPTAAPSFDEALRTAMSDELRLYFTEFLRGDLDFATFLDADFNFVNARLAGHYGMSTTGLTDAMTRVVDTQDRRAGYLGLGATLTVTSTPTRASPTGRGRWILDRLLCTQVPFGPIDTPDNLASHLTGTQRQLVDSIQANAACAGCHREMDGIGMALEGFDEIGAYRTQYADGTPVDSNGVLLDGARVGDEPTLAAALEKDPRFLPCASRTALSYAVARELGGAEAPFAAAILGKWTSGKATLRALLEEIVVSAVFRTRRGEGAL